MSRKFVVSDIHGCYDTFRALLDAIAFTKSDQLFLLGDYINRGLKSKEVIDYLIYLEKEGYQLTLLKGNHEEMLENTILLKHWNPGPKESLRSFGVRHLNQLHKRYVDWFNGLKNHHVEDDFIMVHAGLNFDSIDPFSNQRSLLWAKDWYQSIDYNWLKSFKVIHGHQPTPIADILHQLDCLEIYQVLNIDNGCFVTNTTDYGRMCCFELNSRKLYFQKNYEKLS